MTDSSSTRSPDTRSHGTGFPAALLAAAQPRWSHRDPIEAGNPFEINDSRHDRWNAATGRARRELVLLDEALDREEREGAAHAPYMTRVIALATLRFDVWAHRGLSVVTSDAARADYDQWLTRYTRNWLAYVADTCPQLDVQTELGAKLAERARDWSTRAHPNV